MSTRTIEDLCRRSHEMSRSKGWYDGHEKDQRPISLITLLAQSELIEALEEYRANRKLDEIYYSAKGSAIQPEGEPKGDEIAEWKPEGILVELADCIIRLCQRAGSEEVDMQAKVAEYEERLLGTFTSDLETMLATEMANLSFAYLITTPGGQMLLDEGHYLPYTPMDFFAASIVGIWAFCNQNALDLWGAIEVKEAFNATRSHKHGGKKC